MRLASYLLPDGTASYGIATAEGMRDAGAALRRRCPDLRALLGAGALDDLRAEAASPIAIETLRLLPPIPAPDKILCVGLNYLSHIHEAGLERPAHPAIFTRHASSLVGHGDMLRHPGISDWFDYEGEFAVIIGTAGHRIAADRALEHVAGYSCFNDGSVRDWQRHTNQYWAGKNFLRSGAMGPLLVTTDELTEPKTQHLTTRLNGAVVQSAPISDLAFDVAALIAYISSVTELLPGDVIATGTPSGVGAFREPKLFMKPGDLLEVEITGIGVLANKVTATA